MRTNRVGWYCFAVMVAGVTVACQGCRQASSQEPENAAQSSPSDAARDEPIELSSVDLTYLAVAPLNEFAVSGLLMSKRQVTLKAKLAGEITMFDVREGESLRPGMLVARIDPGDAKAGAAERRALLASADAELAAAAKLRDSQKHLMAAGFVSQAAYDVAEATYLARESARAAAQAQLGLADASLSRAELRASAPGVVYQRHANAGEYVEIGAPIVTVMDPSALQLVVSVPATEIGSVRVGGNCYLTVVGGVAEVAGRIARVNPAPDAGTRAYPVYIDVDNADGRLHIGMFARGRLIADPPPAQAVAHSVLPIDAIHSEGGQDYVLIVKSGRIARRAIKVHVRDDARSRAEVDAPFDRSVPVVLTRHERLREGRAVAIVGTAMPKR